MSIATAFRYHAIVGAFVVALVTPAVVAQTARVAVHSRAWRDRGSRFEAVLDGTHRDVGSERLAGLQIRNGARTFHAWVGSRAIVQLARGAELQSVLHAYDLRAVRPLMPAAGLWLVADARGDVSGVDLASRLAGPVETHAGLLQAVPDLYYERVAQRINVPPNDPRYPGQWFLRQIGIEPAWHRVTGQRAVTVVVVDNGCQTDHPDLVGNMLAGRDVLDGDDDPSPLASTPGNNHGTACAGLIAATADNAIGVAGVCPECTLRCVRLLGRTGAPIPVSADVNAMNFARDTNAAVVSNSWGFVESIPVPGPLATAMEELFDRGRGGLGTLVVFAAGNDSREVTEDEIFGVRGVVTVGALNNFDEAAQFSNFGSPVDLTAPTGTLTTDLTGADGESSGDYTSLFGGTSSACPLVSGVAGLLFSIAPTATASQVHDALVQSTRPAPFAQPDAMGHDPLYGRGIVDPATAIRRILGEPDPDAGVLDASTVIDAAPDDVPSVPIETGESQNTAPGCHCIATRGHSGRADAAWLALALGFALIASRRRVHITNDPSDRDR